MAKSRSIGGIYAELSLRDGKFKAGMKSAGAALGKFAATSAKFAATGGAAAGAALTAGTLRTLDQVDALGDLSAQTGVSIADMMKLQQAYKMGGRAADMAGKDIGKMQKTIVAAASGGEDPFKVLGLSATELLQMNPAAQFDAVGEAIMRIANPAERTAKAMEIFGKGGMGLTTVFEGLPDAARALGKMPQIAQEFGARMGEANDLIGNLPLKSDQFFMGFTAGIVDTLLPGLNAVNEFDFTVLGQNLGNTLSNALKEAGILMNTIFDAFTGQDSMGTGGGNKYREAQMDLDLEDRVASAMKEVENRSKIKNITGLSAAAAASKAARPEVAASTVNDYQRRGLSLDGGGSVNNKEIQLLTEMRDALKRMAAGFTNQPVWP